MAYKYLKAATFFAFFLLIFVMLRGFSKQSKPVQPVASRENERTLSMDSLEDKVRGGWAGQMIGVSYGSVADDQRPGAIYDGPRGWKPDEMKKVLYKDDLYVEMIYAEVMDDVGIDASTEQFARAFRASKFPLWHANLSARRLLLRGVMAPKSGHYAFNTHMHDIDFQTEADFIGLMCPGLPHAAQQFADRVGRITNFGNGLYGGVFMAAMYAAAFFEKDPRKIVEAGLAAIPAGSTYAMTVRDVLTWSAQHEDWKNTWRLIHDNWDRDNLCPIGAMKGTNSEASLNGAHVVLGLLYGKGDFDRTIDIAMRAGQTSDCNASSAGGVLGTALGFKGIPQKWTRSIGPIANKKFAFTDHTFNSVVLCTLERAQQVIIREGGRVEGKRLHIPAQKPVPLKLEQFQPGRPVQRISIGDPRWKWKGVWEKRTGQNPLMRSKTGGAQASISFTGTGTIVAGQLRNDAGMADIYLDNKLVAKVDAYNETSRDSEALWGNFDLKSSSHTIRVVVRGEPYPGSSNAWINLQDLIVYRKQS